MSEPMSKIRWTDLDEAIPAFLAIVLIPLTFSITLGLSLAIIAYVLIKLVCGRAGDVKPVMWFVALLAAALVAQTQ
ncbi:putative adenine permease PurP [compost metagenome]